MVNDSIIDIKELGFQWKTNNPFLFCVHHKDAYPKGNGEMGPDASLLAGRKIGNDFEVKDGWRMYHGQEIPGFPQHPHRGFETVTVVLEGLADHADSLGASGRYGNGDVQWMTAGEGIQHCEMFPLLNDDRDNPLELFQIWLNLPAKDKFVEPYYKMLWKEDIPIIQEKDDAGKTTEVKIIAGAIGDVMAVPPTPDSWAAKAENDVAIWLIKMEAGAEWDLPPASDDILRSLYFYRGSGIKVAGKEVPSYKAIDIRPDHKVKLESGNEESYVLLLQGRPIDEKAVQYGPFVMNSEAEIQQAFADYRQTQFGGWPWDDAAVAHDKGMGRFAKYADGKEEIR
jgi:redox-sensitive bicupin YhaK (pirin superfamily)